MSKRALQEEEPFYWLTLWVIHLLEWAKKHLTCDEPGNHIIHVSAESKNKFSHAKDLNAIWIEQGK